MRHFHRLCVHLRVSRSDFSGTVNRSTQVIRKTHNCLVALVEGPPFFVLPRRPLIGWQRWNHDQTVLLVLLLHLISIFIFFSFFLPTLSHTRAFLGIVNFFSRFSGVFNASIFFSLSPEGRPTRTLEDVEVCVLERVILGQKAFDMVFVHKDYKARGADPLLPFNLFGWTLIPPISIFPFLPIPCQSLQVRETFLISQQKSGPIVKMHLNEWPRAFVSMPHG